eukprot:20830-Pelagomonas_calceolata.AAC.2
MQGQHMQGQQWPGQQWKGASGSAAIRQNEHKDSMGQVIHCIPKSPVCQSGQYPCVGCGMSTFFYGILNSRATSLLGGL